MTCHSEIFLVTPKYLMPHRNMHCNSEKYALQPRNMYCNSEICIATPKHVLPLRNMHCHFEIYIATPKYFLPLRNMHCHSEICIATPKYALPLRNMHFHSEIYFATPKYALPLRNSDICFVTPKYALPLRNMHCYPEKNPLFPEMLHTRPQRTYTPTYALPLRNMHCYPEKNPLFPEMLHTRPQRTYAPTSALPLRNMLCHSEICIATPKKHANALKCYILAHSVPIKHSCLVSSFIYFGIFSRFSGIKSLSLDLLLACVSRLSMLALFMVCFSFCLKWVFFIFIIIKALPQITGSWSRGKALDYRSLGHGLEVRLWTTDHWVMGSTSVGGCLIHSFTVIILSINKLLLCIQK